MPVTLNEPLSALQRLCEQLEYSELLNEAAGLSDPYERMVSGHAPFSLSFLTTPLKPCSPYPHALIPLTTPLKP